MPDTNTGADKALEENIIERQTKEVVDARGTYEILLGRAVIDSLQSTLGEEGAKAFLDAHSVFDAALEKSDIDLFEIMPIHEISAFKSFTEYMTLLRRLATKVNLTSSDESKPVREALANLIKLGTAKAPAGEGETVTSATNPRFGNSKFWGHSLPSVPQKTEALELMPYSYPNFEEVTATVEGYCSKSGFKKAMFQDLNACVKKSLNALALHRKHSEGITSDFRDYLVEAQAYLREHNWLRYGMDDSKLITAAEERGATVKIDRALGHVTVACASYTSAYAFLGVNLEFVLRRSVYALANSVFDNYMFKGKQKAYDCVVSAASKVVQESALAWLSNITKAFEEASKK